MAIRFRCDSCSGLMSIASRKAGSMVQCPTCGEQTLVPMEDIFEAEAGAVTETASPEELVAPEFSEHEHAPPHQGSPFDDHAVDEEMEPPASVGGIEPEVVDDAPGCALRRRSRVEDEMDLTPMVDVTFQLLIFFMVTASFALQKSIQVPTPDQDQKGATQQLQMLEDIEGTSILVKIDAASAITIDDEPLPDPSRLADTLRDKMRKEQKTEMLITANAAALHRTVISVIDAANDVGMQKIRLASRKGTEESR
jgi:biopolymer transport protein ExbD